MDITGIAMNSIAMNNARFMTELNIAVLGKGLDAAEAQGEALQEMMDAASVVPADGRLLDVYA